VALLVAAISVTSWFAVKALAHPAHTAASGASTSANSASAKGATAFAGGTVLSGPGCASSRWAVFSITSGSLETGVGGGDPACGGAADAFRKSGNTYESGSSAAWSFAFKRSVTCTLRIYIADTNPSSGTAVYEVAANGVTRRVNVDQASRKGAFVAPADLENLAATDGVIKITLTDISLNQGDRNHVSASSVSAACQLG